MASPTTEPHELTCRDVSDFLGAYFGDDLAPRERRLFDEHVAKCPDCQVYMSQYRTTQRLAAKAFDADAVDAGVPEDLVQAILSAWPRASGRRSDDRRPARRWK
jgi:anti-sigma factor RsiW